MKIKNLKKYSQLLLIAGACLCFNNCDGGGGGDDTVITEPEPETGFTTGFNPEVIGVTTNILINNTDGSSFTGSIIVEDKINYTYSTYDQIVTADDVTYTYNSLGTSAELESNFTGTGDQGVYDTLTVELADATSALSVALGAFNSSDASSSAAVVKAAGDAVPNLILIYDAGKFYSLDTLKLSIDNNGSGTQVLTGTPITFSGNQAAEGSGNALTKTNTVSVTYRTRIH